MVDKILFCRDQCIKLDSAKYIKELMDAYPDFGKVIEATKHNLQMKICDRQKGNLILIFTSKFYFI